MGLPTGDDDLQRPDSSSTEREQFDQRKAKADATAAPNTWCGGGGGGGGNWQRGGGGDAGGLDASPKPKVGDTDKTTHLAGQTAAEVENDPARMGVHGKDARGTRERDDGDDEPVAGTQCAGIETDGGVGQEQDAGQSGEILMDEYMLCCRSHTTWRG